MSKRKFLTMAGSATAVAALNGTFPKIAPARTSEQKFFLPEESAPHLRTFMQWPVSETVHPDPVFLDMLQQSIADIANTISAFEPVVMLMDTKFEWSARQKLSRGIEIWDIPTDDLWCRDAGPVFVTNEANELAIRHLNFNGWGGKQSHRYDGAIARRIAARLELPLLDNGLVGEAGGVESDGAGTLIAHESSWINQNRNTGTKQEVEQQLLDAIGGEKLIWAPGVRAADITDYHIDSLARFVRPGLILIQLPEKIDDQDPWSLAAFKTYDILKSSRDANGDPIELVVIPEPVQTRVLSSDFVASYVNYYVCNDAVIVAEFGDNDTDFEAKQLLAELYPSREIVALNVDPIGETGGGIHCATQQQPRV